MLSRRLKMRGRDAARVLGLAFIVASCVCVSWAAAATPADSTKAKSKKDDKPKKWDVDAPPGPFTDAHIDTDEGTWMSLDVSPDGKDIVFDMLGDLYVIPMAGGDAKSLTHGVAWDEHPRFSPDGKRIAFTSDRGGGDNIWVMNRDGSDPK